MSNKKEFKIMDKLQNIVNKMDKVAFQYEEIRKGSKIGQLLCNIGLLKDQLKYSKNEERIKELKRLLNREKNTLNIELNKRGVK